MNKTRPLASEILPKWERTFTVTEWQLRRLAKAQSKAGAAKLWEGYKFYRLVRKLAFSNGISMPDFIPAVEVEYLLSRVRLYQRD